MIGVEIQIGNGEPRPGLARRDLIDMAFQRGLLLLPCGPSTVRFCPPLCLTRRQVEIGLTILSETMEAAAEQSRIMKTNRRISPAELEALAPDPSDPRVSPGCDCDLG